MLLEELNTLDSQLCHGKQRFQSPQATSLLSPDRFPPQGVLTRGPHPSLRSGFLGTFDFLYLPIDPETNASRAWNSSAAGAEAERLWRSVAVESEEPRLLFHQFHGSELCADPTLLFFLGADESYTSELRPVSQIIALKSLASPVLSVSHFQASCKSAAWISSRYHRKSIIAWIYIFHPTIP